MSTPFVVGDEIECVDNKDFTGSLKLYKKYRVLNVSDLNGTPICQVIGERDSAFYCYQERFKKVETTPVFTIKENTANTCYLTAGGYLVTLDKYLIAPANLCPGESAMGNKPITNGWHWEAGGNIIGLDPAWGEKLQIVKLMDFPIPKPPTGYKYLDGYPQWRSPKTGECYCSTSESVGKANADFQSSHLIVSPITKEDCVDITDSHPDLMPRVGIDFYDGPIHEFQITQKGGIRKTVKEWRESYCKFRHYCLPEHVPPREKVMSTEVKKPTLVLEHGKTYLTADGYIVPIIKEAGGFFTTAECSPGVSITGKTITELNSEVSIRNGKGWLYSECGETCLSEEWNKKLKIVKELPFSLPAAPDGYRYKDGFPRLKIVEPGDIYLVSYVTDKNGLPPKCYGTATNSQRASTSTGGFDSLRLMLEVLPTVAPPVLPVAEEYPRYYIPENIDLFAYIEVTNKNKYRCIRINGDVGNEVSLDLNHFDNHKKITKKEAEARISKVFTPAPPKITNLCVEVPSVTPTSKQSNLSYWVTEPIGNMYGAAKSSVRYVVISSVLAAVGYTAYNPSRAIGFVKSCLPKVNIEWRAPK